MSPLPTRKPTPFIPPPHLADLEIKKFLKKHPYVTVKQILGAAMDEAKYILGVCDALAMKPETLNAINEMGKAVAKEYPKGDVPTEDEEQEAFVEWLELRKIPFFAVPNGSYKSKSAAARFKKTGLKAGVPDLMICEARGGYHGLFVEMKRTVKYKVSDAQVIWRDLLRAKGYVCEICNGSKAAQDVTDAYLKMPKGVK